MAGIMDWSPEPTGELGAGIYLVEVKRAEMKLTKPKGPKDGPKRYINLTLVTRDPFDDSETLVCWDILMAEGKGRSIAQAKLQALGFDEGEKIESPADIVGRRAWVSVKTETYGGKEHLKVDISAEGSSCGYWSEDQPPDGSSSGAVGPLGNEAGLTEDTPF